MTPHAKTAHGDLLGFEQDGVFKFLGVPYAAPPVGDWRWRPPASLDGWTGEREATAFGPACLQTVGAVSPLRASAQSEDCLYLNVWTPSLDFSARLPVMVWIHGGGNLGGSGSEEATDGARLCGRGVVVVTFNYRLGAFGFAAHPDLGANFGLLDQVAALRWVRDNIVAFGGDPETVTVFGQSAGAVAVRTLLSCPSAEGLFRRGIMESGGFEPPAFVPGPSYARTRAATDRLFDRLGSHDLGVLRSMDAAALKTASHELSGIVPKPGQVHTPANLVWMPVVDGESVMAEELPGWGLAVPLLLGCMQNEARYFIKPDKPYSRDMLIAMAEALCGPNAEQAIAVFDQAELEPYPAMDELFTAAIWTEPARQTLRRFVGQGREAFYYQFARVSPGAAATREFAKHSADIRYVFGNLTDGGAYDALDDEVSRLVQDAWVAFATGGTPEVGTSRPWPRFDHAEPLCAWIDDGVSIRALPETDIMRTLDALREPATKAGQ